MTQSENGNKKKKKKIYSPDDGSSVRGWWYINGKDSSLHIFSSSSLIKRETHRECVSQSSPRGEGGLQWTPGVENWWKAIKRRVISFWLGEGKRGFRQWAEEDPFFFTYPTFWHYYYYFVLQNIQWVQQCVFLDEMSRFLFFFLQRGIKSTLVEDKGNLGQTFLCKNTKQNKREKTFWVFFVCFNRPSDTWIV